MTITGGEHLIHIDPRRLCSFSTNCHPVYLRFGAFKTLVHINPYQNIRSTTNSQSSDDTWSVLFVSSSRFFGPNERVNPVALSRCCTWHTSPHDKLRRERDVRKLRSSKFRPAKFRRIPEVAQD